MDGHGDVASDAASAARQAALVFALSAVFTLTTLPATSMATGAVVAVAAAHVVAAGLAALLPWARWGLLATAGLGVLALVLLGLTTWVSDGYASGLGPMFVLVFVWLGLNFTLPVITAAVPVASLAYVVGLLAAHARPRLVLSVLVLMPIATTVGLLIGRQVGESRRVRHSLEVKDRWRAALMATLAHDVRSPLATVTGVLEILEDDPGTDDRHRRLIGSATRQATRVLRLATGILEVERVEQGRLRLDQRAVDIAQLAGEVAALTMPEHVRVDVAPGVVVHADGARLEQILYNLTNNALRHGRPPVVISAEADGERIDLAVRDHGDGVPEGEVAHLFDRFSSADHSPHSVGLGLWIVKLLTESHGGSVRYEPAHPGARFVVTIPLRDREPAPARP